MRALLPYIPMDKRRLALRVDLAAALTYYVARGRPVIQPDKLPKTPYTWEEITEKTWTNEDLHVPKVIRALRVTGRDNHEMDEELARNAAGLVVREKIERNKKWAMLGHGFDDAWEQISKEPKENYEIRG
jgi:Questin oxidase-like